jgi:uncharacterized surface protein with fasciclin (FAS1) repeats
MKEVKLLKLGLLILLSAAMLMGCSKDDNNPVEEPKEEPSNVDTLSVVENVENIKAISEELGKNTAFADFAQLLATVEESDEVDGYTVFAVPDSVTARNGSKLSDEDINWHVVAGKYTAEDLLSPQTKAIYGPTSRTLKTIGGKTLNIVSDTASIDGVKRTLTYINGIPLNLNEQMLIGQNIVYPTRANIAKISVVPNRDSTEAYYKWLAMMIEGVWAVTSLEEKIFSVYSGGGTELDTVYTTTYIGYREIFRRDTTSGKSYIMGKYETVHPDGDVLKLNYDQFSIRSAETGWWRVSKGWNPSTDEISFYSPYNLNITAGWLVLSPETIGTVIKSTSRMQYGETWAYKMGMAGGNHILYYNVSEITYTLWKIADKELF